MNTKHETASAACISTVALFVLRLFYGTGRGDSSKGPRNVIF